jgi:AcrR family transcriptional regulator
MATQPSPTAARGVRARARAELTEQIKEVARAHLAEQGAAALSLRAVARELGMVSSAVYRYFASRDELLTALIVDAYDALGERAEAAEAQTTDRGVEERWVALAGAVRGWALEHPHEYALVYGSPVPGYAAPTTTVDPAARVALVLLRLLADGVADGEIDVEDRIETTRSLRQDLARLRELTPGVPDAVLVRGLYAWTQVFGLVSFELFGHLHNVIDDHDAHFALHMRRAATLLRHGPVAA